MDEHANDLPEMCPEPWEPDILEDYESLDTDDKRRTFMLYNGYDRDHENDCIRLFLPPEVEAVLDAQKDLPHEQVEALKEIAAILGRQTIAAESAAKSATKDAKISRWISISAIVVSLASALIPLLN